LVAVSVNPAADRSDNDRARSDDNSSRGDNDRTCDDGGTACADAARPVYTASADDGARFRRR
jgi:hypothetical protein